jgi:tetratricopeptide (TPR) repeat protein
MPIDNTKYLKAIEQALESQEFASDEEMNAYIQKNFVGRNIADIGDEFDNSEFANTPRGKAEAKLERIDPSDSDANNRRHALAATKIDPSCTDAWYALGQTYETPAKAKQAYQKAINLGKKEFPSLIEDSLTLAEKGNPDEKSSLWGYHETRSFLMAYERLAELYASQDKLDQAIATYEEILRLNGNDNQGIRYTLLPMYLMHEPNAKIKKLLASYPDDSDPQWLFAHALYEFQQTYTHKAADGSWELKEPENPENITGHVLLPQLPKDFAKANDLLKQAMESNALVPLFLCDIRCAYFSTGDSHMAGGADEAFITAQSIGVLWALDPISNLWLQESCFGPLHRDILLKDLNEHYHHVAELDEVIDQVDIATIKNPELAKPTEHTSQIRKTILSSNAPEDDNTVAFE